MTHNYYRLVPRRPNLLLFHGVSASKSTAFRPPHSSSSGSKRSTSTSLLPISHFFSPCSLQISILPSVPQRLHSTHHPPFTHDLLPLFDLLALPPPCPHHPHPYLPHPGPRASFRIRYLTNLRNMLTSERPRAASRPSHPGANYPASSLARRHRSRCPIPGWMGEEGPRVRSLLASYGDI